MVEELLVEFSFGDSITRKGSEGAGSWLGVTGQTLPIGRAASKPECSVEKLFPRHASPATPDA